MGSLEERLSALASATLEEQAAPLRSVTPNA